MHNGERSIAPTLAGAIILVGIVWMVIGGSWVQWIPLLLAARVTLFLGKVVAN